MKSLSVSGISIGTEPVALVADSGIYFVGCNRTFSVATLTLKQGQSQCVVAVGRKWMLFAECRNLALQAELCEGHRGLCIPKIEQTTGEVCIARNPIVKPTTTS